jgi:hypothetical protein
MLTIFGPIAARILGSILVKIATEKVGEKVLRDVVKWALPRLASLTTNTLDDQIAQTVVDALSDDQDSTT